MVEGRRRRGGRVTTDLYGSSIKGGGSTYGGSKVQEKEMGRSVVDFNSVLVTEPCHKSHPIRPRSIEVSIFDRNPFNYFYSYFGGYDLPSRSPFPEGAPPMGTSLVSYESSLLGDLRRLTFSVPGTI